MSAEADPRIESHKPILYRLYRRLNGETVLQGCYEWFTHDHWGMEWRDILTEYETVATHQSELNH